MVGAVVRRSFSEGGCLDSRHRPHALRLVLHSPKGDGGSGLAKVEASAKEDQRMLTCRDCRLSVILLRYLVSRRAHSLLSSWMQRIGGAVPLPKQCFLPPPLTPIIL